MIVDCTTCPVRGQRCDDCAVMALGGSGSAGHQISLRPQASPQLSLPTESQLRADLQLDAAERRAVSLFVGAGLVNPGSVAVLRARRESAQPWGTVLDVG